ncbi:MAG: hypothetical protein QOI80_141, partial [Solirubrobacteraceae bacterium]|nr:hypothetical protein [Solirubrobacteraceae bacterium]
MAARIALILGVAVLAGVGVVSLLGGGGGTPVAVEPDYVPTPPGTHLKPFTDPFSYTPKRRQEFEARAAAGNAHVLYALAELEASGRDSEALKRYADRLRDVLVVSPANLA